MGFRVNPNSAGKIAQSHFARIPQTIAAPRSAFDRSFSHKTTFNEGQLIPLLWEPILPGDTINLSSTILARLATPIFPYMDNVYIDMHYFFVPNRLLWTHWEKFQGAQDNPGDSVAYTVPQLSQSSWSSGFAALSIFDYFGLPLTSLASVPQANMPIALPLRAYNKIYNDWYRDEDLDNSAILDMSDGPDTTGYTILFRRRRKDYFTSARPWPQKGGTAVSIGLGGSATVKSTGVSPYFVGLTSGTKAQLINSNSPSRFQPQTTMTDGEYVAFDSSGSHTTGLYADLTTATAITIEALREAIVSQQILELDARGGTRYVEALLARFGVVSPDFRLQRSEFLGGQTFDINVSPIAQTAVTGTTPQGNLAAFAVGRGRAGCTHSFVEHGQLLGICSIRADAQYQEGLNRHWSVQSRYDYYEPMMANLGEQAILNKEIYFQGTNGSGADFNVFGWQERWGEYRYKPSYVTGQMRSTNSTPLDSWHLALHFTSLPTLAGLIQESPPIARIVAVPSQPHFIVDSYHRFRHVRVMPMYSAPGLSRL